MKFILQLYEKVALLLTNLGKWDPSYFMVQYCDLGSNFSKTDSWNTAEEKYSFLFQIAYNNLFFAFNRTF